MTTLRRKGKEGVKPPVPLAVQEAIRSSAPPPADPDDGKTQVYRGSDSAQQKPEPEPAEVALGSMDVAQTQVYRIPDKVVARARERAQAQQAHAPQRPAPQSARSQAVADEVEAPNPDAIPTDRPPSLPADDHTAVFIPPPDLIARAQRALAAEEASRGVSNDSAEGNEPADLSLVEALAAVEAREGEQVAPGAVAKPDPEAALEAPRVAEAASTSMQVSDEALSKDIENLRPRYLGYVGWTSVVLLLSGVAYAVFTTLR